MFRLTCCHEEWEDERRGRKSGGELAGRLPITNKGSFEPIHDTAAAAAVAAA